MVLSPLGDGTTVVSTLDVREWSGNLKAMKPHLSESVDRQARQIRSAFDEYFVTGFEPIIPALRLPDPDDRHVLAAAIKCSAQIIVTENQRDFPASHLDEFGIEALGADQFLAGTFELFPMECCRALRSIRTKYRAPPFSTSEFVMDMTRSGLPRLASLARSNIELL